MVSKRLYYIKLLFVKFFELMRVERNEVGNGLLYFDEGMVYY